MQFLRADGRLFHIFTERGKKKTLSKSEGE